MTAIKIEYPLTSVTWLYRSLKCTTHWVLRYQLLVFNWSQAQVHFFRGNSVCFLFMVKIELLQKDISRELRFWQRLNEYIIYVTYREYLSFCAEGLMKPVWNCSMNTRMEVTLPCTLPPSVERAWYTTMVTSPCKVKFTGNDTLPSPRLYSL